ncbi:hypothetical protein Pcar_2559 [Syntrophotalea carbinolica DSM 2380]|uniref:DUF6868 domain-containing protein n=1 Tax=Syntrophotalea carbinolica (strain DSM 2380 / NBRC 103641 / GraBd1) TaxID=338963 RepID=Q3A1G0_SYNC1|nr:hypothetical protein [Syntrophotalea carbinolica]ABA89797.1 hypothetical protein Pcar_2559 [Syntrophotalea carbinolica DSM 2380]
MTVSIVREFFMWCTIINGILLIFSALMCAFAGDWIYRLHGRLFSLPRESFNVVLYAFIGVFKIFFIVFNLVPYLALEILAGA